jgi:hypothetical protein
LSVLPPLPIPRLVARLFALVSLLVALAAAGSLVSTQLDATERELPRAVTTVVDAAASINLQQAASALESAKAFGGSYAGVDVSGFGVRIARADESSYCIEGGGLHVASPGRAPSPGGC